MWLKGGEIDSLETKGAEVSGLGVELKSPESRGGGLEPRHALKRVSRLVLQVKPALYQLWDLVTYSPEPLVSLLLGHLAVSPLSECLQESNLKCKTESLRPGSENVSVLAILAAVTKPPQTG